MKEKYVARMMFQVTQSFYALGSPEEVLKTLDLMKKIPFGSSEIFGFITYLDDKIRDDTIPESFYHTGDEEPIHLLDPGSTYSSDQPLEVVIGGYRFKAEPLSLAHLQKLFRHDFPNYQVEGLDVFQAGNNLVCTLTGNGIFDAIKNFDGWPDQTQERAIRNRLEKTDKHMFGFIPPERRDYFADE